MRCCLVVAKNCLLELGCGPVLVVYAGCGVVLVLGSVVLYAGCGDVLVLGSAVLYAGCDDGNEGNDVLKSTDIPLSYTLE